MLLESKLIIIELKANLVWKLWLIAGVKETPRMQAYLLFTLIALRKKETCLSLDGYKLELSQL